MTIFRRKPIMGLLAFSILLLAAACREPKQAAPLNLFDLQTRQSIAGAPASCWWANTTLISATTRLSCRSSGR